MSTSTIAFALVLLRGILGLVFIIHGVKHFINREKTIRWTASIGFRKPAVQWLFMTFAEIGIGVGLITGIFTSVAAAGLVAMMFVAFWTVHRHAGFLVSARPDEGYEYVLVLSIAAVTVAILGPGEWSLDHAFGFVDALDGVTGGIVAGSGVLAGALQLVAFYRPGDVS